MEAISRAGTDVYEPINHFELSVPADTISKVMFKLSLVKAQFEKPLLHNDTFLLTGTLPMAPTEDFKRDLNSLPKGEGIFMAKPWGVSKIEKGFPTRKSVDYNPLNVKDYRLHNLKTNSLK